MSDNSQDTHFMSLALAQAQKADEENEVPIGAVIVNDSGEVIGEGYNRSIACSDPSAHAEIQAIRAACQHTNNYRLPNTTLYVTVEPCVMCVGAIVHARISRVVYGTIEPKMGAAQSAFNLLPNGQHFHHVEVEGGVMAEEAKSQVQNFFKRRRLEKKEMKGKC